jgi:hypothetical protein
MNQIDVSKLAREAYLNYFHKIAADITPERWELIFTKGWMAALSAIQEAEFSEETIAPSVSDARVLISEAIELCAVGDVDEHCVHEGWAGWVRDSKAWLSRSLGCVQLGLPEEQSPKYTISGSQIVNRMTGNPIPADEPIFILRASDKLACGTIGDYANLCSNEAHAAAVQDVFIQFGEWSDAHPDRMKEPDTAGSIVAEDVLVETTMIGDAARTFMPGFDSIDPTQHVEITEKGAKVYVFRGNTVAHLADRAKAYGDEITAIWKVLGGIGVSAGPGVRLSDVLEDILTRKGTAPGG